MEKSEKPSIRQMVIAMDIVMGMPLEDRVDVANQEEDEITEDFMFEHTQPELKNLRSQFASSSWGGTRYPRKNMDVFNGGQRTHSIEASLYTLSTTFRSPSRRSLCF